MKTLATATIQFGAVDVPVRIFASRESPRKIELNQLHKKCGARLKQKLSCPNCDTSVEEDDIVKGHEVERNRYVTFTAAELASLDVESDKRLSIIMFVDVANAVNVAHVEECYFVGPDVGSEVPYMIITRALQETARAGVASHSVRGHRHIVLLYAENERLVMAQMRPQSEVRDPARAIFVGDFEVPAGALRLAKAFIRKDAPLDGQVPPMPFEDEHRKKLQAMIHAKVEAGEIIAAPTPGRPAPIADLTEALEASVKKPPRVSRGRARRAPAAP